jgi:SET domain-containing protein
VITVSISSGYEATRSTNIPNHPRANGESGLFATKDLKPGTFILQYLGRIHTSSPSERDSHSTSDYDLSLDREHGIGIDAKLWGNEARFINDYRGVAERPNAEFKEIWDERRKERGIGVFVLPEGKTRSAKGREKGIRKGEEILVSYGKGFWGARKGVEEDTSSAEPWRFICMYPFMYRAFYVYCLTLSRTFIFSIHTALSPNPANLIRSRIFAKPPSKTAPSPSQNSNPPSYSPNN